ncbi:tautomerase family protein [Streptomyces sp. NBC_01320]|uniref:tautomerase family protein n=1 Tax=Streptomyces sp. NBC_01320 TaxID=2903824 RepID=UPI002E0F792C|nr:tautomerase family protein [Streptomyces sp. NBC_01320]
MTEHDADHVIALDAGLGFARTDRLVLIQIFTQAGRTTEPASPAPRHQPRHSPRPRADASPARSVRSRCGGAATAGSAATVRALFRLVTAFDRCTSSVSRRPDTNGGISGTSSDDASPSRIPVCTTTSANIVFRSPLRDREAAIRCGSCRNLRERKLADESAASLCRPPRCPRRGPVCGAGGSAPCVQA